MKSLWSKKKFILIFLIAILLPLITTIYLSLDTFFERRQSTRRLLESNLWFASKSALTELENKMVELENQILSDQTFAWAKDNFNGDYFKPFILNKKFNIIYPATGLKEYNLNSKKKKNDTQFEMEFSKAEKYEFQRSQLSNALKLYENCYAIAKSKINKARALDAIARVHYTMKNFSLSVKFYKALIKNHTILLNNVGHPYKIIALIQLAEINNIIDYDFNLFDEAIDALVKLNDGFWSVNYLTFRFLKSEIESILQNELKRDPNPDHSTQFDKTIAIPSNYFKDLKFADYLKSNVILKIKETAILGGNIDLEKTKRLLVESENDTSIVSYKQINDISDEKIRIIGFQWELDSIYNKYFSSQFKDLSNETSLKYHLSHKKSKGSHPRLNYTNSLLLPFSKFPLPWDLLVIHPGLNNLDEEVNKEMVIFGSMLTIIIVIMIMGVFLIVRDFRRESDSMKIKTEFIHNVSHELKTPLSLIRLYGETLLIKKNIDVDDKIHALKVITKESERLSHMINNILDFSKIEMGKKEFQFKKGNIAKVIIDTLDSYSYHLEKKGFKIIKEIDKNIPLMVFEEEAIEGLLINILSNAIKYSQNEKSLTVKLFQNSKIVFLQVADKGIGIPADEIPHIFDRFYRTKQKIEYETRGSGLGLTLVKHVVEAHGGKVNVVSKVGLGTTFYFEFPIYKPDSGDAL